MKRKGRFSVSPKRILTSIKASSAVPNSPIKPVLRTHYSPVNPFFSTPAAQDRHRTLFKLYGHFDLERELFPMEKRNTITIPKVKEETTELKSPEKPLLSHQDCSPAGPLVYALTPKVEGRTQTKVCYINLSEYVHTSERYESAKAPSPKKVLTQGNKSHLNRAEKPLPGHLLLSGKSALQHPGRGHSYTTRMNRTVPNIQLSDTEDNYKEIRVIRGCIQGRRIKSASRARSRADSAPKSRFDPADKAIISPPQVTIESEGNSSIVINHDRTTSISTDFNLPVSTHKQTRFLQLNKVDLGQMLDVPSPKAAEAPRRRPASAKFAGKRPFWRLDDTFA